MRCPKCSHRLLHKSGDKVKLRTNILVFTDDGATCVINCPGCGDEIQVPISLEKSAIPPEPKLVLGEPAKLVVERGVVRSKPR